MIEGVGWDKISDLTTNIIREKLANYTAQQCELHEVPTELVELAPYFLADEGSWAVQNFNLPIAADRPILLVPKAIARTRGIYDHRYFYRHFALTTLQAQHLRAGSSLVRSLKNKKKRVFKKDLERLYPCTKEYIFRFASDNPEVLSHYRDFLSQLEKQGPRNAVTEADEMVLAAALRSALAAIPGGSNSATEYHRFMVGILEFLFFPTLGHPRKEQEIHEGRKRIDILMENCARIGIFERLHSIRKLPSAFIVFECKNYTTEIANPELDQIAGRFSPNRGKVGFICCRRFENRALFIARCRDTFRDDRGLIAAIDDDILSDWLTLVEQGRRRHLDDEVTRIVDEVWVA
jgi:hypothetical protein